MSKLRQFRPVTALHHLVRTSFHFSSWYSVHFSSWYSLRNHLTNCQTTGVSKVRNNEARSRTEYQHHNNKNITLVSFVFAIKSLTFVKFNLDILPQV